MATTKKQPVAKSTPAHKAAPKTTRKQVVKKQTAKKPAVIIERSFKPSKEKAPFMTFEFTIQSVYWLILSALVLALGAWVMHLNVQIQEIYDQIEANAQLSEAYVIPANENTHPAHSTPSM
jgi:hypothetical protein